MALGLEPRTLCVLGKHSSIVLQRCSPSWSPTHHPPALCFSGRWLPSHSPWLGTLAFFTSVLKYHIAHLVREGFPHHSIQDSNPKWRLAWHCSLAVYYLLTYLFICLLCVSFHPLTSWHSSLSNLCMYFFFHHLDPLAHYGRFSNYSCNKSKFGLEHPPPHSVDQRRVTE